MIRGKTKEEYKKWLDESTNKELLNSLDAGDINTMLKDLNEFKIAKKTISKESKDLIHELFIDGSKFQKYLDEADKILAMSEDEIKHKYFPQHIEKSGTNPNLDMNYRLQKIIRNYQKFGNVVVGVDFDFTLVDAVTNETYEDIVQILKRGQRKEIIYCIWTANDSDAYVKSKWLEAGLEFSYYNESPINTGSVKPHFNILLDDSAGLKEALDLFVAFLDYLDSLDSL